MSGIVKNVLFLVGFVVIMFIAIGSIPKDSSVSTTLAYDKMPDQHNDIINAGPKIKNKIDLALRNEFVVKEVYVKKSNQHANAYYVGAIFIVESKPLIGIWITNATEDVEGLLFSVNSFAIEFSQLPLLPNETLMDGINEDTNVLESYLKKIF